jgi:hypothetical protein
MPRRGESGVDSDGVSKAVQFRREVPDESHGFPWQPSSSKDTLETCPTKLSYFAVIPLLLTCIASLFLTAVGATLVVTARERNEGSTAALRATL